MAGRTATLWSLICRDSCETHAPDVFRVCVCRPRGTRHPNAAVRAARGMYGKAASAAKEYPTDARSRPTADTPLYRAAAGGGPGGRRRVPTAVQPLGPVRTAIRSCSVVSTVQRMRLKNGIRRASDLSPLPPRPGPKGTFARDRISCTVLQFRANAQPLPDRRLVLELEAASVEASWACRDRDGR